MRTTTLTPICIPLRLRTGVSEAAPDYQAFLANLADDPRVVERPSLVRKTLGYTDPDQDERDCRICVLALATAAGQEARVHVFPETMAVAEISIAVDGHDDAGVLDGHVQQQCEKDIAELAPDIERWCRDQASGDGAAILEYVVGERDGGGSVACGGDETAASATGTPRPGATIKPLWCGRTLRLTPDELQDPVRQRLVRAWLEGTGGPGDADALIAGTATVAMRWLRYVLVEEEPDARRYAIDAMNLAQFFYAVQEVLNIRMHRLLGASFRAKRTRRVEARLREVQTATGVHEVRYYEIRKYLSRNKKALFDEILAGWGYGDLLANAERMIELTRNRLAEIQQKRRERASVLTDFILAAIGAIAILELTVALSSYSRDVATRPIMRYFDSEAPLLLRLVAGIDASVFIAGGLLITVILLKVYWDAKTR